MGKRALSVCYLNGAYFCQEFEKRPGRVLARPPVLASTPEVLTEACRMAEEIDVAGEFSTSLYDTVLLPKVPKKYLMRLIAQDAREKLKTSEPIQVRFDFLREATEAGVTKWQVSYVAVPEAEMKALWDTLKPFQQKIRHIVTVPSALGAAIRKIDSPADKFILIWIKDSRAYITVNSPEGIVHMERVVPLGVSPSDPGTAAQDLGDLLYELMNEISMTVTFYKRRFRRKAPKILYCLGSPDLNALFSADTWSDMDFDVRSSLSDSSIMGLTENELHKSLVSYGSLQPAGGFNFVPDEAHTSARESFVIKIGYAVMLLFVAAGFGLSTQLNMQQSERLQALKGKQVAFADVKSQIAALTNEYAQIKAFDGWVTFYDAYCSNAPRWDKMLTQLTNAIPDEIVINELKLHPENGTKGIIWKGKMKGMVRATYWQEGLKLLRKYGENLQASSAFDVMVVEYEPKDTEKAEAKVRDFEFRLQLRFLPEERSDAG